MYSERTENIVVDETYGHCFVMVGMSGLLSVVWASKDLITNGIIHRNLGG